MLDPLSKEWLPELETLGRRLVEDAPADWSIDAQIPAPISASAVILIDRCSFAALALLSMRERQKAFHLAKDARKLGDRLKETSASWSEEARARLESSWFRCCRAMAEAAAGELDWSEAVAVVDNVLHNWPNLSRLSDDDKTLAAYMVESAVRLLLPRVRIRQARELVAAVPDDLRERHPAWHEIEDMVARLERPATRARPAEEPNQIDGLRASLSNLEKAFRDEAGKRLAKAAIGQIEETGRSGEENIRAILSVIYAEMGNTRVFNEADLLKEEAFTLYGGFAEADPEDLAARITRLHAISIEFLTKQLNDDHVLLQILVHRLEAKLGRSRDALRSICAAIEGAESRLWQIAEPFAGGEIAGLRYVYDNAVLQCVRAQDYPSAQFLTERFKDLLAARVQGRATLFPAEHIRTGMFPQTSAMGTTLSLWALDAEIIVIVRSEDGVFRGKSVSLERKLVRAILEKLRPSAWRAFGMFAPTAPELLATLSMLTDWIPRSLLEGKLLTISPDGGLHNIPWHLLTCGGQEIVRISPSQIVLALPFGEIPKVRRLSASVICAPAGDESHAEGWRAWAARLSERLRAHLARVDTILDLDAGVARCIDEILSKDIVHVRSHGYFPAYREAHDNDDAFQFSGLLLACAGALPDRSDRAIANLTPAVFGKFAAQNTCNIGHITLEACVSGVSVEGITAAPISLPWMLNLYSAKCVLASYWDIETAASELFFDTFYDAWLGKGLTRPEALQFASLAVLAKHGSAAAGFRLLGACND